jgi:hypothetical protein
MVPGVAPVRCPTGQMSIGQMSIGQMDPAR